MRIQLKANRKSILPYHRIQILVPNFQIETHLCETEKGLIAIPARELMGDLDNYQIVVDRNSDFSHVIKGG